MHEKSRDSKWTKRILLVEDNPDHGLLIRTRLRKLDESFQIDIVETGEDALEFMEKNGVDLILLDYELPGINGIQVLEQLREKEIMVPCIFLTGQGSEQIAINALRAGASDYFTKEEGLARYERLVNSIHKAINKLFIERELEEYRQFLETIIDTIPDPIFIKDREHRWVVLNDALCKMVGYSKCDMLRKSDYDFFPKEEADFFWEKDEEMFRTGQKVEIPEEPITDSQGRVHYLNTIKVPLKNPSGEITHLVGIIRDITERKQILEELREKKEYFRFLIEKTMDNITVLNVDGTIRYQSPAVERLLGYSVEEYLLINPIEELLHPDDLPAARNAFEQVVKNPNEIASMEVRIRHKNGTWRIFEGVARNLLDVPVVRGVVVHSRDVTEQKHVEKELRFKEEQLRLILENTMDVIYSTLADGTIIFISPQVAQWDLSPHEIIGRNFLEFIHPEDTERMSKEYQKTIKSGEEFLSYFRLLTRHGRVIFVEEYGKAIFDGDRVVQVTGVIRDITDRNIAQEALYWSQGRYRNIFEYSPISLLEIDLSGVRRFMEGLQEKGVQNLREYFSIHQETIRDAMRMQKIVEVNKACLNLFEAEDKEEFISNLDKIFIEESLNSIKEGYMVIAEGGSFFEAEFVFGTLKEKKIHVFSRWCVVPGHEGKWSRVIGFLFDLTDQRRSEEACRRSEENYRNLAEAAPDTIYIIDRNYSIEYINSYGARKLGLTPDGVIGKPIANFFTPEILELQKKFLREVFESGSQANFQANIFFPTSKTWQDIRLVPLRDDRGRIRAVLGISRDITERKQYEEELKTRNLELENFIHAIAHDLRSPLMSIREYGTLILNQYGDRIDREIIDFIHRIQTNSEKTMEMMKGLQNYAQYALHKETLERFDLGAVMQEVVSDLSMRREFVSVKITLQNTWPQIWGDSRVFYQIFLNLIENAGKYGATEIEISWDMQGSYYLVWVRDNGIGIEDSFREKAFDVFSRSPRVVDKVEGAGMGLAIVKRAVEKHGGKIWVESKLSEGSVFYVTIPAEGTEEIDMIMTKRQGNS